MESVRMVIMNVFQKKVHFSKGSTWLRALNSVSKSDNGSQSGTFLWRITGSFEKALGLVSQEMRRRAHHIILYRVFIPTLSIQHEAMLAMAGEGWEGKNIFQGVARHHHIKWSWSSNLVMLWSHPIKLLSPYQGEKHHTITEGKLVPLGPNQLLGWWGKTEGV